MGAAETLVEASNQPYKPVMIGDFGAQYVDVIYWQLVERGYRCEIIPLVRGSEAPDPQLAEQNYGAVIYTGSGDSVNEDGTPQADRPMLEGRLNSLGICYGAQAITKALGGLVGRVEIDGHHFGEYGKTTIEIEPDAVIYNGLKRAFTQVMMSHGDSILELPEGFRATGMSGNIIASFESADERISGTQFHPEVGETDDGVDMMVSFLEHAGVKPDPNYNVEVALGEYMDREEADIAEKLLSGSQIRGFLSGGVDSRVACEAVVRVARKLDRLSQVEFYYVNTGHNRIEDDKIIDHMQADGMPVINIDAAHRFFHERVEVTTKAGETFLAAPLVEETNPEIKRLIIGNMFKMISMSMMKEAQLLSELPVYFVQGTNQSDIVESGGLGGKQIKGHHNVEAMEELRKAGILIEPLRGLMKYHIRNIGENRYGLPERVFKRQPFPGVGISPRIVANPTGELEPADAELQARLDDLIEQWSGGRIKGHIVNMKTVGAQGDDRSLANAVFLEGEQDWNLIDEISKKITDSTTTINRVFYVPGETIKRGNIRGFKQMDDEDSVAKILPMEELHRQMMEEVLDIARYLSQYFVASLPVDLNGSGKPTLTVRHFITGENLKVMNERRTGKSKETFRTGIASTAGIHIEEAKFHKLLDALQRALVHFGLLVYDVTAKPPGSTEYE